MAAAGPRALGGQSTIHAHHGEDESVVSFPRFYPKDYPRYAVPFPSVEGRQQVSLPAVGIARLLAHLAVGKSTVCMGDMGKIV